MVSTELAPRRQQFHVAPAMPALKYTTSVDIQKMRYKKLVTHVESHASAVSLLKRAENISDHESWKRNTPKQQQTYKQKHL